MLEQAMSKFAGNALIRDKFDNYIGGKWVAPVRGAYFDNISPVTGQVVCQIARGTAEDIELALDAAHAAKDAWGKASTTERSNTLLKIADRMEANLDKLAVKPSITKPIRETTAADLPLAVTFAILHRACAQKVRFRSRSRYHRLSLS